MFAGDLSAWARALECRFAEIDLDLIGLCPASLALTPERLLIGSQSGPLPALGEILTTSGGCWVGGKLENFSRGPLMHHDRWVHEKNGIGSFSGAFTIHRQYRDVKRLYVF